MHEAITEVLTLTARGVNTICGSGCAFYRRPQRARTCRIWGWGPHVENSGREVLRSDCHQEPFDDRFGRGGEVRGWGAGNPRTRGKCRGA